jgi:hypothetical protein
MSTTPPVPPVPPAPKTKKCLDCDTECGENEKECPKCKAVFEEVEQEMGVVERSLKRLAKKKKQAAVAAPTATPPTATPAKRSVFSSLNRKRT